MLFISDNNFFICIFHRFARSLPARHRPRVPRPPNPGAQRGQRGRAGVSHPHHVLHHGGGGHRALRPCGFW